MPSLQPCGTWIDVQEIESLVVFNLQDMGMTADE